MTLLLLLIIQGLMIASVGDRVNFIWEGGMGCLLPCFFVFWYGLDDTLSQVCDQQSAIRLIGSNLLITGSLVRNFSTVSVQ